MIFKKLRQCKMQAQNELKKKAALAALEYLGTASVIGVGTGSTVDFFIEALASKAHQLDGAVASSVVTEHKLKAAGIPLINLNSVDKLPLYIDGADEFNPYLSLIKGGGGALTREKIIAATAEKFICIADSSKQVKVLGQFPLPVEVIPMARGYVARQLVKMGGSPEYREGFLTDNGNIIIDVYHLDISEPIKMEKQINNITGVVCNGIFAMRGADVVLMATKQGVQTINASLNR